MSQVKVHYDRLGNTLTVWFGDPKAEAICEETGDEVILMKDQDGNVIGFEKLNFRRSDVSEPVGLEFAESASQSIGGEGDWGGGI